MLIFVAFINFSIGIFPVDDENKSMQLNEQLEMTDFGDMNLTFTQIIPDNWLSERMIVRPNDERRKMLLQQIIKILRAKSPE